MKKEQNVNTTTTLRWHVYTTLFQSPMTMGGSYTSKLYMSVFQRFTSKRIAMTCLYNHIKETGTFKVWFSWPS